MPAIAETVSARLAAPVELQNDEASLIRAAQRGDQGAFERLVRSHDQAVLRLASNLLRSPDEARERLARRLGPVSHRKPCDPIMTG